MYFDGIPKKYSNCRTVDASVHKNTMSSRRSSRSSSSSPRCCCSSHSYLCPTHRDRDSDSDSDTDETFLDKLQCFWERRKHIILGISALLIVILLAYFYIKQHNALVEIQQQMKNLKQTVDSQKNLIDLIQEDSDMDKTSITNLKNELPSNDDVKHIVKREIYAYDADKIAQVDYALESAGGKILSILATRPYVTDQSTVKKVWESFASLLCSDINADTARPILQPKMSPGECWAFEGSQGAVMIKLLAKIYVQGITIEHIPAAISPSPGITSAPKVLNLWGLKCKDDSNAFLFGEFKYKNDSTPIQYFKVQHKSDIAYDIVLLKILSNWGNQQYTCVYRVRIHGELEQLGI